MQCGPHAVDNRNQVWCGGNQVNASHLAATPRTLLVRKASDGMLYVSVSEGEYGASVAIAPGEFQYELLEVVRDEGPREFTISY